MTRGQGLVALALGSTLLVSASGGGAGSSGSFDALARDSVMQRCIGGAGMSLDGASDWSTAEQLAWATYQATGGDQQVYRRWFASHPQARESAPTPDAQFFKFLEDAREGSAPAQVLDGLSSLSRLVARAQEGDLD